MKNKRKTIVISCLVILAIAALLFLTFTIVNDENKLTIDEKQWINTNISNIQNVNVINDVDIVGKDGSGVFYDFIDQIELEYNLTINPITYASTDALEGRSFKIVTIPTENHLIFKEEHYVLIGKKDQVYSGIEGTNIGILESDEELIGNYISSASMTTYENKEALYKSLNDSEGKHFILVPLEEELTTILEKDYVIYAHFSDIQKYFVYELQEDDIFSSIVKKYFVKYKEDHLEGAINKNTLNTFVTALNITEKDLASMQAKEYNYGFINNSPYEVLTGGNYGGIVSEYIKRFSAITKTDFKFTKYRNYNVFAKALNDGEIDVYFNYYDIENNFTPIPNGIEIQYDVLSKENENMVVNSIQSLRGKEVYVKENSLLSKYLSNLGYMNVQTYKDDKELKKVAKKDSIIIMDHYIYGYLSNTILTEYTSKYIGTINQKYTFKVQEQDTFYTLFSKYISTLDNKEIINVGLYNHKVTVKNGTVVGTIAKYSLLAIIIIAIIIFIGYRSTKRIKIVKKIKKEDKMRYIDQLTSLKNRNYLSENITNWNKNTIYPQATIVLDLDNLQAINDTQGYEAGDEQIKAAANILIKTQLDNSDIIRTDGNEFLIYLIGYEEKQVVSYIRKLYKEFKNLPHEHGATIGYSMILDDIKTIEDAVNEAVDDMKEKKEEQ